MRGVSGSGKSTLARKIAEEFDGFSVIYSTDDFFMVDGEYLFDPKRLGEFHAANVKRAEEAMADECALVIIDNTNTQAWEMKPYVELAEKHGYNVRIVETDPISFNELMERQTQRADQNKALPAEVVLKMIHRYESNVTVEMILASKRPF